MLECLIILSEVRLTFFCTMFVGSPITILISFKLFLWFLLADSILGRDSNYISLISIIFTMTILYLLRLI